MHRRLLFASSPCDRGKGDEGKNIFLRSLSAHPTPVDDENLSINVQAGVACEEHSGSSKVFWSSPTTSGDPLGYLSKAHRIGEEAFIHIGGDVAWCDCVDLHVVLCPFVGKCLRQLTKSTFGSCVCGDGYSTLEGQERGKVDDLPSTFGNHMATRRLAQGPTRRKVRLDNIAPILFGKVYRWRSSLDPRTIDQDVDFPTHDFQGFIERFAGGRGVRQIGHNDFTFPFAVFRANSISSSGVRGIIALDQTDVGTSLSKGDGTGGTDASGSASD